MSDFINRNKPIWDELEQLVERGRKSIRKLTADELGRLDVLYRQTTIHLSQVSTNATDRNLYQYLNSLAARAHSLIYLPPRRGVLKAFFYIFVIGFACSIARHWRFHLASFLLMISGGLVAYYATLNDSLAAYAIMPPMMDGRGPGATKEQLIEVLRSGRDQSKGEKFAFASFLFSHNFKVGVLAMAVGILAAIPTALLMFYNGMILGVFAAVHHQSGIYSEMWAWILPHGVTEMGAVILCGGVGILIGKSAIAPGKISRYQSLKLSARAAGLTLAGAGVMLFFAAIIESFLRQSNLSTASRLWFAAATLLFWILYIGTGFYLNRQKSYDLTNINDLDQ